VAECASRFSIYGCVLLIGLLSNGAVCAAELADPTQPLVSSSAGKPAAATDNQLPVLQSIIYSRQQRRVVLNGQVCREGTQVGRYRVQAIYADRVVVEADGVRHTLRLFSHKVRYE
jgi:hypothetical protein